MKIWIVFLVWYSLSCMPSSSTVAARTRLRFLSLLPGELFTPSHSGDPSLRPILKLAVKHINEKEGLLDGYEIVESVGDSGCSVVSVAQFNFVKHIIGSKTTSNSHNSSDSSNIVGIVGPICAESAMVVAELASKPQIALINVHQATAHSLQPSRRYSFSTFSPASDLVAALTAFTKQAGWKRVAVLYEMRLFYREMFQEFAASVRVQTEIVMELAGISNTDDISPTLSAIQSSGYRVIFLFMGTEYSSETLCWAINRGLYFPNYQWILMLSKLNRPFEKTDSEMMCNADGFKIPLKGSFLVYPQIKKPSEELGNETNHYHFSSPHERLLYDSVWALALAINNSLKLFDERGISLREYKYGMSEVSDVIAHEMLKLEFNGVSGYVAFGKNGFSNRPIEVTSISEEGEEILYAQYSFENFTILDSNAEIIGDSFPFSSPALHPAISIVFFTFILLHLIVLVTVHAAIIVFRKKSSVKASSYKMNQFIFAGNYLYITALCLNNFIKAFSNDLSHETIGRLCHVTWPWAISIGSTLILGSISLRTWRIYRIFIHYLNPGGLISDKKLCLILFTLVGIDIIVATAWTATDPIGLTVIAEKLTDKDGQIFIRQSIMCISDSILIWLNIIMFYKSVLISALLVLAILTRKIKDEKFTTHNLRIVSYTYTFTIGFGLTLYYFLFFMNVETIIDYVVLNVLFHSLILQTVVLVLLPPLLPLLKEKLRSTGRS